MGQPVNISNFSFVHVGNFHKGRFLFNMIVHCENTAEDIRIRNGGTVNQRMMAQHELSNYHDNEEDAIEEMKEVVD